MTLSMTIYNTPTHQAGKKNDNNNNGNRFIQIQTMYKN